MRLPPIAPAKSCTANTTVRTATTPKKGGVICSEILLPPYAPPSFSDRETLWNEVEKAERGKKAQLAYSFDIALQNEFSMQENIELARQFLLEQFVSRGHGGGLRRSLSRQG